MRPAIAAFALVVTACAAATTTPDGDSTPTDGPDQTPPAGRVLEVVHVLDGDSLLVDDDGAEVQVRLLGVNAPEAGECWGDEARRTLIDLVGDTIVVTEEDTDRFGRTLAYVYDGSTQINRTLVATGAALALSIDHPDRAEFVAAEESAYDAGRGLWSPTACGEAPPGDVAVWTIEFDAPGRDDENRNGEFVVIANEGGARDLSGWTLRDESSVHRFSFPEGFVAPAGGLVVVRTGCGRDTPDELFWCADGAVWNNSGDTVLILDRNGTVVDRLRYSG